MTPNRKINVLLLILAIIIFAIIFVFGCGCARHVPTAKECAELYPLKVIDSIQVDTFPVYLQLNADSWKDGYLSQGTPPGLVRLNWTDSISWANSKTDTFTRIFRVKIPCKTGVKIVQDGALLAAHEALQHNYKELENRYNKCQAKSKEKAPKPRKKGWRLQDWFWLILVAFLAYQAIKR